MLPQGANEASTCCSPDCRSGLRPPDTPPPSNHLLLTLDGQGGGAYIALLPSGTHSAEALVLPLARRKRVPECCWVDAAETSEEEEDEDEDDEGGKEEEDSVPSTPPKAQPGMTSPPPPVEPRTAAPAPAPAITSVEAGELISSAVSGRTYAVLRTIAGGAVGHGKEHTSILLAAPLQLGEGGGAGVLLPHKQTAALVVIKVVEEATYMQRYASAPPANGRAIGELAAHQRLLSTRATTINSPAPAPDTHVLPLLDVLADAHRIYMVFPYADGPDLFEAVAATPWGLPEAEARRYFASMVKGVVRMKRHGVSHGDLSLENACLHRQPDGSLSCHIIDLEMARLVSGNGAVGHAALAAARLGLSHGGGKAGYVSPEGAYGTVLDWHAADVWSLGVCLYMMLTARPLYTHPDDRAFEILACGGAPAVIGHYASEYGLVLSQAAAELVISLLKPDPADRPTAEGVLLHPWLRPPLDGVEEAVQGRGLGRRAIPEAAGVQKQ